MSNIFQAITQMQSPFNMIVMVVLIGCTAGVIGAIAREIRTYICHRNEMEFKREMLDRGLAPDEIEQVMRAKPNSGKHV